MQVAEIHPVRRKLILAKRPELKALGGRYPQTALFAAALLALQFCIAAGLAHRSWYWALLAAGFVGAFIAHGLNFVVHECAHNLVLRKTTSNKMLAIFANLLAVAPSAIAFRHYHLLHHRFQGEPGLDPDLPPAWEARLVGSNSVRKLIWLVLLPLAYGAIHPFSIRRRVPLDIWLLGNVALVFGATAAVAWLLGWSPLLFLAASSYLAAGPHPTGAHILQEHVIFDGLYETASYYGPINRLSGNLGYHVEHHDFTNIPGPRLPMVKEIAAEFYQGRHSSGSRLMTLWRFVSDREVRLDSRMLNRVPQGYVP